MAKEETNVKSVDSSLRGCGFASRNCADNLFGAKHSYKKTLSYQVF